MRRSSIFLAVLLVALPGCRRPQAPEVEVEEPARPAPEAVAFGLRLESGQVELEQGARVRLKVLVDRSSYFGPLTLTGANLPKGVTVPTVIIPGGQSAGEVEVKAGPDAAVGLQKDVRLTAQGEGSVQGCSPPLALTVVEPPFLVRIDQPEVQVPQ